MHGVECALRFMRNLPIQHPPVLVATPRCHKTTVTRRPQCLNEPVVTRGHLEGRGACWVRQLAPNHVKTNQNGLHAKAQCCVGPKQVLHACSNPSFPKLKHNAHKRRFIHRAPQMLRLVYWFSLLPAEHKRRKQKEDKNITTQLWAQANGGSSPWGIWNDRIAAVGSMVVKQTDDAATGDLIFFCARCTTSCVFGSGVPPIPHFKVVVDRGRWPTWFEPTVI